MVPAWCRGCQGEGFILRVKGPRLIGTALYGAVRRVVFDPWLI